MIFDTAVMSKQGGRRYNEDCCDYVMLPQAACWVLADGLGGHRGGAIASQAAVAEVLREFKEMPGCSAELLQKYIIAAQHKLLAMQQADETIASMRTTMVVVLTDYRSVIWGHIGDSRLYYFRSGQLQFQTKDHSVPQMLVDMGKISLPEIRNHEDRNRLIRALGQNKELRLTILEDSQAVHVGDAMLLCSDGFWELVQEEDMVKVLADTVSPAKWLNALEQVLLEHAKGEFDNYSAIAIITG